MASLGTMTSLRENFGWRKSARKTWWEKALEGRWAERGAYEIIAFKTWSLMEFWISLHSIKSYFGTATVCITANKVECLLAKLGKTWHWPGSLLSFFMLAFMAGTMVGWSSGAQHLLV